MRHYSVLPAALLVLVLAAAPRLSALTDEEKRQQFLDARSSGDEQAATPHHKHHGSPSPTPHRHHRTPTPEPDETPRHRHSPTPDEDETPAPHPHHHTPAPDETPEHRHHSPTPDETPRHHTEEEGAPKHAPEPFVTPGVHHTPTPSPERTPGPQPFSPTPAPAASPTPAPTPPPGPAGAQVEIEKQGLDQQGGLEPPPPTPPPRHHWWQFLGGEPQPQYHYLTKAVRDAIDRAPVARHRWRFIVVHNSGTRQGNARIFDYYHRTVRKMPNGLAYQFVIGNGTSSGNGQIEIGSRWTRQINGGHVHSDYLNNIALGICLVGDFNRDIPTQAQLDSLDELIRYLRTRVGKIDRKPAIVKAHREINPPQWPTDCPGDRFPYHWLHSRFD